MNNIVDKKLSFSIPILTYHSIDDSGSVTSVSPATFKWQMDNLWQKGYRTLSLSETIKIIRHNRPFPEKTVVITFDDGYQNTFTEAFPVLDQYSFKATIFVITDFCGKVIRWPGFQKYSALSWSEIKKMHSSGFEIGAHTVSHPDLTRISMKKAEHEILRSKIEIQDHLGDDVDVFAYPFGKYNSKIKQIAGKHFAGACSTRLRKVTINSDPYTIERIDMYYLMNNKLFNLLATDTLKHYLTIRQFLRDLKGISHSFCDYIGRPK